MRVSDTPLPGVRLVEPVRFEDGRGFFEESWNRRRFEAADLPSNFVQDNRSRSARGVLRGLHYQREEPQGKLVRVTSGRVFDVAVDVRRSSDHFGRWFGVTLSERDARQLWVPAGFAHGFYVLSEFADVHYRCTAYWNAADEHVVHWSDPDVGVSWPLSPPTAEPLLSERDRGAPRLRDCRTCD